MQKGLIAVAAAIIIGAGIFILAGNDEPDPMDNSSQNTQQSQDTEESSQQDTQNNEAAAGTITYTDNGFSPATLNVKSGDTITVTNDSSSTIQFDSDPHPAHTSNTELNVDTIRPGQSKSFTANRKGTFGYHDHLNPKATGTIIVK